MNSIGYDNLQSTSQGLRIWKGIYCQPAFQWSWLILAPCLLKTKSPPVLVPNLLLGPKFPLLPTPAWTEGSCEISEHSAPLLYGSAMPKQRHRMGQPSSRTKRRSISLRWNPNLGVFVWRWWLMSEIHIAHSYGKNVKIRPHQNWWKYRNIYVYI